MKFAQFVFAVVVLQVVVASPFLKPLSTKDAERFAAWTPESDQNMWEFSGQYEGDMVLAPGQRNGATDTRLRWPNREIPYEFSNDFTEQEKQTITQSLATEFARTCITVRPRTATDADYVYVAGQDPGCSSNVGRFGGRQNLNLHTKGCIRYGIIVHEFLHAAGFYHQQSATERDDFVDILWQNIEPGHEGNFEKQETDNFGERYDYGSLMHYGKYAFSKNEQPTILPKDPTANIGQSDALSTADIRKLNKMYGCV